MKVDANLHFLLYAHIDVVAVVLEQGMFFGFSQVVGDHLGTHFLRGDLRHPAKFLFGFGGVAEQGFDFGGAEVAGVDADYGRLTRCARDDCIADFVDACAFPAELHAKAVAVHSRKERTLYCTPVAITKSSGLSCCSIIHCMRT